MSDHWVPERDSLAFIVGRARAATDHHLYYRGLNRAAAFLAGLSIERNPDCAPDQHPACVAIDAEAMVDALERRFGADLLGYGGRPLFPALRKRLAETLVELGY